MASSNSAEPQPSIMHFRDQTLIEAIERQYGLAVISLGQRLGGLSSRNQIVHAGSQQFVLKSCPHDSSQRLDRIALASRLLRSLDVPAVEVVQTVDSATHFTLGRLAFILTRRCTGRLLHEPSLSMAALESAASMLTRLHIPAERCAGEGWLQTPREGTQEETIRQASDLLRAIRTNRETPAGRAAGELIELKMAVLSEGCRVLKSRDMLTHCLVHGDFHNENVLYDETDKISCLLDLESVHIGDPMEDITLFISLACCNTGFWSRNITMAKAFLNAYRRVLPLPPEVIVNGFVDYLRVLASSYFLERQVLHKDDPTIINMLLRDIRRIIYLRQHLFDFLSALLTHSSF